MKQLRYQALSRKPIGHGQYGSVYKALEIKSGRTFAVKLIKCRRELDTERTLREVAALRRLRHPRIVHYYGAICTDEFHLAIVMEYVENGSLQQLLHSYGPLHESLAADFTFQTLDALMFLHSAGVIHCDLKAANILINKAGSIKLSDFGVNCSAFDVAERGVMASPYWMAPELIDLRSPTTASDIWSLGCLVIELVTGDPPYASLQPWQAVYRIVTDPIPPLPPGTSRTLTHFLQSCFARNPALRFTAFELGQHSWFDHVHLQSRADSIPALQRISAERNALTSETFTPPIGCMSKQENRMPATPPLLDRRESTSTSSLRPPTAANHQLVRSVFACPVACSVCLLPVPAQADALICRAKCGLVCHAGCFLSAPPSCEPPAQSSSSLCSLNLESVDEFGQWKGLASRLRSSRSRLASTATKLSSAMNSASRSARVLRPSTAPTAPTEPL